jgi:hypothetical protein
MDRKKCVVCGKGLSLYNQHDRCFHHVEKQKGVRSYQRPVQVTRCTSHNNRGLNRTWGQEYGAYQE